ncbi:hypothetical protein FA95DRAFT_322067 [Auriscalpium vulgare]|uniref:Uncharacterized protein n=1 Tax=Auriscalpium vulgare TaxID=40419 RepID=A0ACB8S4T6_9AGAM|nr:hypothetical protein FA95DRAFT_322067 [Auriscalpium vulgare]
MDSNLGVKAGGAHERSAETPSIVIRWRSCNALTHAKNQGMYMAAHAYMRRVSRCPRPRELIVLPVVLSPLVLVVQGACRGRLTCREPETANRDQQHKDAAVAATGSECNTW